VDKRIGTLLVLALILSQQIFASSKCTFAMKSPCLSGIPQEWQPAAKPGSVAFKVQEVCLNFSDYAGDPGLCSIDGSIKLTGDIAAFVAGVVANNATRHDNNLDLWVKAPGLEPGDAHTIRTVTYMQATSFTYFLGIKNQSDEWYPDVKCAISLQNPESPTSCSANGPTASSGLLNFSSSCVFNQNKHNTLLADLGQIIVGSLSGPVGLVQVIVGLNPGSPGIDSRSGGTDLPTGGAIEVAYVNTCPNDVQSLNNGTGLLITRSGVTDYNSAKLLAEGWNQQPTLAAHIRGDVPKSVTIAKNDSYWHLAGQYYSSGQYWIGIAQANDWRKLFPGTIVQLPPMQQLLFQPCYIHKKESLWKVGLRLKKPFNNFAVAQTSLLQRPRGRDSVYPLEKLNLRSDSNCQ
jgi:hypothetical protein